jgi:mycothiol synthase
MAAVVEANNKTDGIPYIPSASNLREELTTSTGLDITRDVLMAEVDGVLVGNAGVERTTRSGIVVYELWGHVDPAWRRRGIGGALLDQNLRRAAERAATEPVDQRVEVGAHVEDSEVGHRAILERRGFQAIRWFFLMRRPHLQELPPTELPDGLALRPVTPDQHRAIWDADNEAFQDHWQAREPREEDFPALFAKEDLDTGLWTVAWDGDEVAGSVQSWIWTSENEALGVRRGWLEHVSVRRPWRRRGLAQALIAEALRKLAAAGMDEAMLGVDAENPTGALGLYEGLGFEVHGRSLLYRRPIDR